MSKDLQVEGLSSLQAALDRIPAIFERRILRGALRAGAKVQQAVALDQVPVGSPSTEAVKRYGGYAGALRDSIRISVGARGGIVRARVIAGGKSKRTNADVFYAHIVEGGSKAHVIRALSSRVLSFDGVERRVVHHPGTRAKPFMARALNSTMRQAVDAVAEYIRRRLARAHGITQLDAGTD